MTAIVEQEGLFVNRQLNYDEAVRRLRYWSETPSQNDGPFAKSALRILVTLLQMYRDNLYFEEPNEHSIKGSSTQREVSTSVLPG